MGRTQLDLARNLIQTLGARRAVHVAKQYCWYGVAEEIARMTDEAANGSEPPTSTSMSH